MSLSEEHDPSQKSSGGDIALRASVYPLGRLTIAWILGLNLGLGWSAGSLFTYVLSLHFARHDPPSVVQRLLSFPLIGDLDDLAGLLCYSASFGIFAVLAIHLAVRAWWTRRLPYPQPRSLSVGFLRASILLAPVWVWTAWFFENYRHDLPGDGNWPAIACLTGIASFHWFLIQSLMPRENHKDTKAG